MTEFRQELLYRMRKRLLRFKNEEEFEEAAMIYFACRCAANSSKSFTVATEFDGARPFVLGAVLDNRQAYEAVEAEAEEWNRQHELEIEAQSEGSLAFVAPIQNEVMA